MIGVVVAHPDDETVGMGGTIAKLAKDHEIALLVLADGVTSRLGFSEMERVARAEANEAAADILGIERITMRNYPDQKLDQIGVAELSLAVDIWLTQVGATSVYTHHCGDLNADHRLTAEAVLVATRPVPGQRVRKLYSFEVPSSTEWGFGQCGPSFQPNVFEDITETIETKLKALTCYASELREYPHPRSLGATTTRAEYWGSVIGATFAEAFQLIRSLRQEGGNGG